MTVRGVRALAFTTFHIRFTRDIEHRCPGQGRVLALDGLNWLIVSPL